MATTEEPETARAETVPAPYLPPHEPLARAYLSGIDRGYQQGAHDREVAISEAASQAYARGAASAREFYRPPQQGSKVIAMMWGVALGVLVERTIRDMRNANLVEIEAEVIEHDVPDVRD